MFYVQNIEYISYDDEYIKVRPIIYDVFIEHYDKKIWQLTKLEIDTWFRIHNLVIHEELLTVNTKYSRLAYFCIEYYNFTEKLEKFGIMKYNWQCFMDAQK